MITTIRDIIKYRAILWNQVITGIKLEIVNTWLGILWIVLEPLLLMALYYFLVVGIFNHYQENFILFILPAIFAWQWFARSFTIGVTSFQSNASIISKRPIPLIIVILAPIFVYSIYPVIGFLIIYFFTENMTITHILLIIPILLLQFVLMASMTTIFAVLNVFIPDVKRGMRFLIRALWFISPVLYTADRVLGSTHISNLIKNIYLMNPFVFLLSAYRSIFNGQQYSLIDGAIWGIVAVFILFLAMCFLHFNENNIKKMI